MAKPFRTGAINSAKSAFRGASRRKKKRPENKSNVNYTKFKYQTNITCGAA
jgi:hypothetical protein